MDALVDRSCRSIGDSIAPTTLMWIDQSDWPNAIKHFRSNNTHSGDNNLAKQPEPKKTHSSGRKYFRNMKARAAGIIIRTTGALLAGV